MEKSYEVMTSRPIHSINDAKSNVGKAVCKIKLEKPWFKTYGTGFLCQFSCLGEAIGGLFTCCHVMNCLEEYKMEFELTGVCLPIKLENVKWFFTDRDLDFTFIAFSDAMNEVLLSVNGMLSVASSDQLTEYMDVTVVQYPGGNGLSYSEGKVFSYKNCEMFYTPSTQKGSSGAPIVNSKSELVAIHKYGGPVPQIDNQKKIGSYNVGTLMSKVIESISQGKPWENLRWKKPEVGLIYDNTLLQHNSDQNFISKASSLCKLSFTTDCDDCHGNGFLCCVTILNNVTIYGLFTNKHVIPWRSKKTVEFHFTFANDKSTVTVKSDDLTWVHCDNKLHFTFVAFNLSFTEKLKYENRNFLTIAKSKPSTGSRFSLIQYAKDTEPIMFEGTLQDCSDIYLYHEGTGHPQFHGSLVLNEDLEVIAVGNSCNWPGHIGTFITEDIVAEILNDVYQTAIYSESTILKDSTDLKVKFASAALCKISTKNVHSTGFLCKVPYGSNREMKGLFTAYECINYKQSFKLQFDNGNVDVTVESKDVLDLFSDKTLGFTFVTFRKLFVQTLLQNGLQFLPLITEQQPTGTDQPILLLHHPKGKEATLSRGIVKGYEGSDLLYLCYTKDGSAGAPILNESHQVIGIHKGNGRSQKIGTQISDIVEWILTQRLYSSV